MPKGPIENNGNSGLCIFKIVNRRILLFWRGLLMKKILLFTVLIALGFAGGSIMPQVWAETGDSKTEQSCNCGCGPTEVKVLMVPTSSESDMMLTTGLIEAISNDSDNTLTKEELVTIIHNMQEDFTETTEETAVKGASITLKENGTQTTLSSYEELINRFLLNSVTTTTETNQTENDTIIEQSSTVSGVHLSANNKEETNSTNDEKIKNNNGLGNGSEPADGTSNDVKGIDPSNPGNGQKNSTKSTTSKTEVKSSNSASGKTNSSKSIEKKEKVKNNNGLGNGSEPADGTSSDIKGIDPSNPGNGGSKNNASNK